MLTLRHVLFLVPLIGPAFAAAACNPYTTFTAKFEALPTASAVPSGFGTVSWTNFDVARGKDYAITPASGSKVAIADRYDSVISQVGGEYGQYTEAFSISSFFFACYTYEGGGPLTVPCSIFVVAQTDDRDIAVQQVGTFSYDGGAAMANTTLPSSYGGNYRFFLVGGQGNVEGFVFDNVVIVNYNPNCPQ